MFRRATLAFLALLTSLDTRGHPEIDEAVARLSALIAAAPDDATLFLRRAELYAKHDNRVAAETDFAHAEKLAPDLPPLARARGQFLLMIGQPSAALPVLDRAVMLDAADADALVLRARAHARLGHRDAAISDYNAALRLLPEPRPELFLERAATHADAAAALRSLDEGLVRLGPVLTLQLRAIEFEISLGHIEAALARLDEIIAAAETKEPWLERRAQLAASGSSGVTTTPTKGNAASEQPASSRPPSS